MTDDRKYYYILDSAYSTPSYYYNSDIHATMCEYNTESDGAETSELYTWDEILSVLDDGRLLTDDVPDDPPTEILKEENGNKILIEYEVQEEKEWDDEGHFEIRYYNYIIQICRKEN